ncbi:TIGR02206 family membrane protein [Leptospira yasudae]|uniref:TIGR02206 family membrane protein n=1 Tax=Leptospira yasudae TaxID=2202201 RepID=A0A6N4R0H5_9LEPT|nr:TIGR02206 family membrane protein [Leptospira yasudae]TGL77164.1 TIGR02206 family membrane protein [Leptospira yasudae]TGL80464.1 TIGR02206 family membrane protein [Leptospira yasudae]TGL85890.1 TIGR02206 family membrane protein [Leptospira yasudae]
MDQRFQIGSALHYLVLFLTVSAIFVLLWIARKDRQRILSKRIGFVIAWILILNYLVYVIYRIDSGHWEIRYDLPMEFCNWAMIVTSIALLTHNRTFAELSYFWVMSGSVNGVITPDLQVTFPHIYFFIFFIAHSGLVIASLYIVFGLKLEPRPWAVLRAFLYSQIFFVTAFVVDYALDGNYGYMMSKPSAGSALDYLGEWPYYLIHIQLIGVGFFILLYLPFALKNRKLNPT